MSQLSANKNFENIQDSQISKYSKCDSKKLMFGLIDIFENPINKIPTKDLLLLEEIVLDLIKKIQESGINIDNLDLNLDYLKQSNFIDLFINLYRSGQDIYELVGNEIGKIIDILLSVHVKPIPSTNTYKSNKTSERVSDILITKKK